MGDDLLRQMLDDVRDQSTPQHVREKFNNFYQRRQYKLQHKKEKYIARWSHFALTSDMVDKISIKFAPNLSKVQFEIEQAVKRHQRLSGEDHFNDEPRPQRIEPNGMINPEDVDCEMKSLKHCTLRLDDIEIYTRIVSYESACNRPSEKYINRAKYVPLSHRFDVYQQAQERFQTYKQAAIQSQQRWDERVKEKGNYLIELRKLDDRGHKQLQLIESTLPIVKKAKQALSTQQEYQDTYCYQYYMPPFVIWNQIDLKLTIEDLCSKFKIVGDMEIDDGNSFSYAVVHQFPAIFFGQMIKTQFAPYDAVPQVINPIELGRGDILQVMAQNVLKYGKNPAGSTLLEQLEIEKQSEKFNVKFINKIEKALFGEFNNGQLEDFPKVRLKQCHWLPYVCFKASISTEQQHQASLLAAETNPIDSVAVHIMEIININDCSNVNLTLESMSQIHFDKVRNGRVRQAFHNLDNQFADTIFTDQQRLFLREFIDCLQTKNEFLNTGKQMHDEAEKNSLFECPQHLLFAQYLTVCLNAREHKTRLLYILNAFRSVQKRIALELRVLGTRDRVSLDVSTFGPREGKSLFEQFYQNEELMKDHGKQGDTQAKAESVIMDEMIDINKYRFNGLTQTHMWSTCPVLPKFHSTFGDPIERQEFSTEFEVNKNSDPRKQEAARHLGRIDFIEEKQGFPIVKDDFGVAVMYDCTFADMRALEKEMLKVISYFINKVEPFALDFKNMLPMIDRFNFIKEILICEDQYQQAKLDLVFCYLECYEHTFDTLEQQQLIQLIIDLMAKRPRINLEANTFIDSYKVEVASLQSQTKLMREFIKLQMQNEKAQNDDIRESLEKTYRLIYEQIDNKWQYLEQNQISDEKEKRRLNQLGVNNEDDIKKMKNLNKSAKPNMFNAKVPTLTVDQFAEMLGMPKSSLQMLLKDHHERDPTVKQSLHEHVSFIKLQEGYPVFLTETEVSRNEKICLVPKGQQIGILEMYESLSQVVKVAAAGYHACQEIKDVLQPDNGMISSLYELITQEYLLAEFRAVQAELMGDQGMQPGDMAAIEDASILGNPEKMLFFVKELIAAAQDPELIQNPFVLTKIDIKTIENFDFDDHQGRQVSKKSKAINQPESHQNLRSEESDGADELQQAKALDKIIDDPDSDSMSDEELGDADDFSKKQKLHEQNKDKAYPRLKHKYLRPNIPSMLEICCNQVEVLRLRHLLIEAYYQRTSLIEVYKDQCKFFGKDPKVFFASPFQFTAFSGGQGWINFVDDGPVGVIDTELAIKEFDPTLASALNFANPEAFKALVCPLGLEELRTVVRYELLNLQMLIVATRHNQVLLDTSQRQLKEIELFEKKYLVSAPSLDLEAKLTAEALYDQSISKLTLEERRKITRKITDRISKLFYSIVSRKMRPRNQVEQTYKKIRQSISELKIEKTEVQLRYLRSSRLLLAHDYCTDLESQLFLDSIKMELFYEVNQIRRRAYLLPRDAMVFKLPLPRHGEHTYANYNEENYQQYDPAQEWTFYDGKQITDFWKLPSFEEIATIALDLDNYQRKNIKTFLYTYSYDCSEEAIANRGKGLSHLPFVIQNDQKLLLKTLVPKLNFMDSATAERTVEGKGRFIDYHQAPQCSDQLVYKYLFYFRNVQNLFDLEYFRNKLASRAYSIATLEQSVMSGKRFWEDKPDDDNTDESDEANLTPYHGQDPEDIQFRNKKAEDVVKRMGEEKKKRIQLITELDSIKDTFKSLAEKMMKFEMLPDLAQSGEYLQEIIQIAFNSTMLALQTVRENQAKSGEGQKELQSLNELLSHFSHTNECKITYLNGYHVNLAVTQTSRISLDSHTHRPDYHSFFLATLPIMDEAQLNPSEFNLIRGIYTANSLQLKSYRRLKPHQAYLAQRDLHFLDSKLLNVHADLKKFISATIKENTAVALNYAHAKFKTEYKMYQYNYNTQKEVFQEQKQFQRHQMKVIRLKQALMILLTRETLPNDSKKLKQIYDQFNDLFSWKVMNKADNLEKIKRNQLQARADLEVRSKAVSQIQAQISKEATQELLPKPKVQLNPLLLQFDNLACEIDVYQREIQNYMILTAQRMIERETKTLANAFELNGKRLEVLIDVHQQFAATTDDKDKLGHLDIVNKVSAVQKLLSQFKNRMLKINTLTGGDGIIIRTKDLLQILDEFTRGIVKSGEIEMRTRTSQLVSQITQYESLLYGKDRQIYTLEHKLAHAEQELQKITVTKVFARGSQLIYEHDHAQRQLRMIKDNVWQMEAKLKEQISLSFDKDLQQARLELDENRKKFAEYQQTLNAHMRADISKNINELDVELKKLVQHGYVPVNNREKTKEELIGDYSQFLQGQAKQDYKTGGQLGSQLLQSKDLEQVFREMERLKQSENEAREEVLEMQNLMRKQRMLTNFTKLVSKQRQDLREDNLKHQLNSNALLWEQLAESEKRERVLKQELQRSQEEVATLDKVLERLKDELKAVQLEKHKLLSFKESNKNKTTQLETMTKQIEVVSNIDLDKVLLSVNNKEKQLQQLKHEQRTGQDYIQQIRQETQKQLQKSRLKLKQEQMVKESALSKMEVLRAEIQLLQSGDLSSMNLWKDRVNSLRTQKQEIMQQFQTVDTHHSQQSLTPLKHVQPAHSDLQSYHQKNLTPIVYRKQPKHLPTLNNSTVQKRKSNIFDQLVSDAQHYSGAQSGLLRDSRSSSQMLAANSQLMQSQSQQIMPLELIPISNFGDRRLSKQPDRGSNIFSSVMPKSTTVASSVQQVQSDKQHKP